MALTLDDGDLEILSKTSRDRTYVEILKAIKSGNRSRMDEIRSNKANVRKISTLAKTNMIAPVKPSESKGQDGDDVDYRLTSMGERYIASSEAW